MRTEMRNLTKNVSSFKNEYKQVIVKVMKSSNIHYRIVDINDNGECIGFNLLVSPADLPYASDLAWETERKYNYDKNKERMNELYRRKLKPWLK